jgi:hypothetical protein
MVLIQQTRLKDTINGKLKIQLIGSQSGNPTRIDISDLINEEGSQALRYSFKYFQTIALSFHKPADFIPEQLEISTTIYQYRKTRGEYSQTIDWSQVQDFEGGLESE